MSEGEALRFPLRVKLALLASGAAAVPLAVVAVLLVDVNAAAVRELSLELQMAVVEDVARTVESELGDAADSLHGIGRILTGEGLSPDAVVAQALALVEGAETVDVVAIFDRRGELIDVVREEGTDDVEVPAILAAELRRAANNENVAVGRAVAVQGEGAPRVMVAVPFRAGGRVTGYAASPVSLDGVQRRVARLATGRFQGDVESVFVVDDQLRIVAHSDPGRAVRLDSAAGVGVLASLASDGRLPANVSWAGEHGEGADEATIGTVASLQGIPWAVVVQVPRAVAYASLSRMRTIVVGTVILAIVLSILAGVLVASRMTAPLARLTQLSRDIAARRFDRRVRVETGDELALLGDALSGAAEELEASEAKLVEEAAIRADLGRYLPAELVEKVVAREQDMALGGTRREVTVLFADVVAFTPMAEKLEAEETVTILNELFTILTEIVFRHGGTVDKLIGDCLMAVFGAPTPHEDHAARALSASEDMLAWLEMGNATWQERYDVTIRLAIGVSTGEAVVGNVGSKRRMEYTAIGEIVNLAARLEAMARPQQILVTEATRDAAGKGFDFADAGEHEIAGVSEPVRLFEVRPS